MPPGREDVRMSQPPAAVTRREMILRTGIAIVALSLAGCASIERRKTRRVLFFSKSSVYEHSVIHRNGNDLSFAEKILVELGPKHGVEFTFSKDGSLFDPDYVKQFDAFCFYTCDNPMVVGKDGFPAMTPMGKAALLEAINGGKGFVGIHSASDTFHSNLAEDDKTREHLSRYKTYGAGADDFTKMLGGEFIVHAKQQKAKARVIDNRFPGFEHAGTEIEWMEEWYSLKEFAKDLHVLLVQETDGMAGEPYKRPPYPNTWARMFGKGRVFYTALGHREDTWTNPLFQQMLFGGIAWAVGDIDADITPNLEQVTPQCDIIPPVMPVAPSKNPSNTAPAKT